MTALSRIRQIDYTVIFCRDLAAMANFYGEVLGFQLERTLSATWMEYRVGSNILALTIPGTRFHHAPVAEGAPALQLAFRVAPDDVKLCQTELEAKGVVPASAVTDQPFGHRTLFFRDPDGNILEIYAEIDARG